MGQASIDTSPPINKTFPRSKFALQLLDMLVLEVNQSLYVLILLI